MTDTEKIINMIIDRMLRAHNFKLTIANESNYQLYHAEIETYRWLLIDLLNRKDNSK